MTKKLQVDEPQTISLRETGVEKGGAERKKSSLGCALPVPHQTHHLLWLVSRSIGDQAFLASNAGARDSMWQVFHRPGIFPN
jgi:hypothetical protein